VKIEKLTSIYGEFVPVRTALEVFKAERLTTKLLFRLIDSKQVEMMNAKVKLRDIAKNLPGVLPREYVH